LRVALLEAVKRVVMQMLLVWKGERHAIGVVRPKRYCGSSTIARYATLQDLFLGPNAKAEFGRGVYTKDVMSGVNEVLGQKRSCHQEKDDGFTTKN
jgi:hypothetical protein